MNNGNEDDKWLILKVVCLHCCDRGQGVLKYQQYDLLLRKYYEKGKDEHQKTLDFQCVDIL